MTNEFIKVPFYLEKDGSKTHFLPTCRTASGYRFGEKGKERVVTDYWEALNALVAMEHPTFRRKDKVGNSGGVKCQPGNVEEVSRAGIQKLIETQSPAR